MHDVVIAVCGDHWLNIEQVQRDLKDITDNAPVRLLFNGEGPSMHALGVVQVIESWCSTVKRDPSMILVAQWSNAVEHIPFRCPEQFEYSHFMGMSRAYWLSEIPQYDHEYRFAFFMGRRTVPRSKMLFDLKQRSDTECLFSRMRGSEPEDRVGRNLETVDEWVHRDQQQAFYAWWQHELDQGDASLDNHTVQDQYNPKKNTNLGILQHYHRFSVEIVCETYARGNSYFPTEKTIRPLMAGRALIAHAPRFFLRRLREQGFKTWHTLWNEHYDDLEGPARWNHILGLLTQINAIPRDELTAEIHRVGAHNRRRLAMLADIDLPDDQAIV